MSAESRLIWALAWRFVRGRRTRLLAGTTWAALLATALGVAAMVIAMALMTGYRHDLQAKLVQGSAAVVAYPIGDLSEEVLDAHQRALRGIEGVTSAERVVYGQGSLASGSWRDGREVMLRGIESSTSLESVCRLELRPGVDAGAGAVKLVVGSELFRSLGIVEGERLRLMVLSFATGRPRFEYRSAVVSATCSTGFSEFDRQWVLLGREELETILGPGANSSVLEIGVERVGLASVVAARVRSTLGPDFLISDFFDLNRELFTALRLQQLMLFLVLGLIVLVSTFNTASSLVVMVRERRRDLGVLSALGLSPAQHRVCFLAIRPLAGRSRNVAGNRAGLARGLVDERVRADPVRPRSRRDLLSLGRAVPPRGPRPGGRRALHPRGHLARLLAAGEARRPDSAGRRAAQRIGGDQVRSRSPVRGVQMREGDRHGGPLGLRWFAVSRDGGRLRERDEAQETLRGGAPGIRRRTPAVEPRREAGKIRLLSDIHTHEARDWFSREETPFREPSPGRPAGRRCR